VKTKATAVVLIHEIFGLTDWVRGMVDQMAEAGYIAIAPDFLSGAGPNGGGSESLGGPDGARGKISGLAQSQIDADLDAAVAYVKKLDACNGKVVVGGFCWGGGKTFLYATHNPDIKAGLVFYGSAAKPEDMPKIKAPIHGFYASNDARINAGLPAAIEGMKAAGKFFEPVTYEGAGHGFMRAGEDPAGSAENKQAREDAWKRIKAILAKL
jgi:carboxymethylenebutenolidase